MKLANVGPDLHHQVGGLLIIAFPRRVWIEPEMVQRRRQDVVGRIEQVHAAVLEPGEALRLEHNVPTVDPAVRAEELARLLDVVADAGGAPHIVDAIEVAGVVFGEPARDFGPGIGEVR